MTRARFATAPSTSPTALADQDALNALLMSEFEPEDLALQPEGATSQGPRELADTEVVDPQRLDCRRAGEPIRLLHCWGVPKPWQAAAGRDLRRTAYLALLRELLDAPGVAVHSTQPRVPWLAAGARGAFARQWRYPYGEMRRSASRVRRKLLPRAGTRSDAHRERGRATGAVHPYVARREPAARLSVEGPPDGVVDHRGCDRASLRRGDLDRPRHVGGHRDRRPAVRGASRAARLERDGRAGASGRLAAGIAPPGAPQRRRP